MTAAILTAMAQKLTIEVVKSSAADACLVIDDTRVDGPKLYGIGKTLYSFEVLPMDIPAIATLLANARRAALEEAEEACNQCCSVGDCADAIRALKDKP